MPTPEIIGAKRRLDASKLAELLHALMQRIVRHRLFTGHLSSVYGRLTLPEERNIKYLLYSRYRLLFCLRLNIKSEDIFGRP